MQIDIDKLVELVDAVYRQHYLQTAFDSIFNALPLVETNLDLEARLTLNQNAKRYLSDLAAELEQVGQLVTDLLPLAEAHYNLLEKTAKDVMTSVAYAHRPSANEHKSTPLKDSQDDFFISKEVISQVVDENVTSKSPKTPFSQAENADKMAVSSEENDLSWQIGPSSKLPKPMDPRDTIPLRETRKLESETERSHEHTLAFDQLPYTDAKLQDDKIEAPNTELDELPSLRSSTPEENVTIHETDVLSILKEQGCDVSLPENPKATLLGMGFATDECPEKDEEINEDTLTFGLERA